MKISTGLRSHLADSDTAIGILAAAGPVIVGAVVGIIFILASKNPQWAINTGRITSAVIAVAILVATYRYWDNLTPEEIELAEIGAHIDGYGQYHFGFEED